MRCDLEGEEDSLTFLRSSVPVSMVEKVGTVR